MHSRQVKNPVCRVLGYVLLIEQPIVRHEVNQLMNSDLVVFHRQPERPASC